MVYLALPNLQMVIFHGYVSHNQMVYHGYIMLYHGISWYIWFTYFPWFTILKMV